MRRSVAVAQLYTGRQAAWAAAPRVQPGAGAAPLEGRLTLRRTGAHGSSRRAGAAAGGVTRRPGRRGTIVSLGPPSAINSPAAAPERELAQRPS
jgi:hypothetical protein